MFSFPLISISTGVLFSEGVTPFSILFSSTATAVRVVCSRPDPAGASPVWCVRGGLCWLLSGQRPLLCLGRQVLLTLLRLTEEVSTNSNVSMSYTNCVTNRVGVLSDAQVRLPGWLNGCLNCIVLNSLSINQICFLFLTSEGSKVTLHIVTQ